MLRDVSQDSADEFPRFCFRYSSDELLPRHAWSARNATSNPEDNHPATSNPEDHAIFTELAGDQYAGNFVRGVSSLRRLRMARRAHSVARVQLAEPTVPRHGPSAPHRSQHCTAITVSTTAATCSIESQDAMISDETNDGVSEPHEKSSDGDRRPRHPSARCDGRPHRVTFKFIHPLRKPSQERSHRRQQPSNMQPSQERAASTMACAAAPEPELAHYGNMQPPQKRVTSDMACAAGFGEPLQERSAIGGGVACATARTPELVGFGNM